MAKGKQVDNPMLMMSIWSLWPAPMFCLLHMDSMSGVANAQDSLYYCDLGTVCDIVSPTGWDDNLSVLFVRHLVLNCCD